MTAVTDDLDEVLVERAMRGGMPDTRGQHTNQKTAVEIVEAIRRLTARGAGDPEIGRLLGKTRQAIFKIRVRNDIPSPIRKAPAA